MIVIRQAIVTFLILLQLVAPLLHAHSGMELSEDSIHIPGLEIVDNHFSSSETLEPLYQNQADGIVVGVCSGINQANKIIGSDLKTIIVDDAILLSDFHSQPELVSNQPEVFYPTPPFLSNATRAPPQSHP